MRWNIQSRYCAYRQHSLMHFTVRSSHRIYKLYLTIFVKYSRKMSEKMRLFEMIVSLKATNRFINKQKYRCMTTSSDLLFHNSVFEIVTIFVPYIYLQFSCKPSTDSHSKSVNITLPAYWHRYYSDRNLNKYQKVSENLTKEIKICHVKYVIRLSVT